MEKKTVKMELMKPDALMVSIDSTAFVLKRHYLILRVLKLSDFHFCSSSVCCILSLPSLLDQCTCSVQWSRIISSPFCDFLVAITFQKGVEANIIVHRLCKPHILLWLETSWGCWSIACTPEEDGGGETLKALYSCYCYVPSSCLSPIINEWSAKYSFFNCLAPVERFCSKNRLKAQRSKNLDIGTDSTVSHNNLLWERRFSLQRTLQN